MTIMTIMTIMTAMTMMLTGMKRSHMAGLPMPTSMTTTIARVRSMRTCGYCRPMPW